DYGCSRDFYSPSRAIGALALNRRLFFMGLAGAALGCTSGRSRRLNVYNWENYVASTTIPGFEREFNAQVRYATYGSAEEMLAKVMSGNSGWDVVFPSNSFVEPMRALGLLASLDHSRLPNLGNLDARFQSPEWDRSLEWCVPYMHSATGILYSRQVSRPPLAWADLWTDSYSRRVTMLDDSAEVFGACLKRLGCSVNSGDEGELKKARDLAIQQKPLLRAYLSEEVRDQVIAGDVLAAQMWAQVAQVAMDNSTNLAFSFPAEGFALYADNVSILRESKHKDLAYKFVDYLLQPKVAAAIAMEMRTATANAAARAILPEAQRNNTILYPTRQTLERGEWFKALPGPAQRLRDRYWTEIKSA
ncbi:MAG: spermidine/putrescine ABC transporter substrate-binding protein, partial [Bryobacteraceae bacterium]